jgi:hypothetical protein
MDFRKKLEAMVEGLRTNPRVRILEALLADPAAPAEIEQARDLAKGSLPAGVEELYRQMNGFRLRWEHCVERLRKHSDADRGFVNILPLLTVFGDWEGLTAPAGSAGGDEHRPVKPVDDFIPEACAALYQEPGRAPRGTVYYHVYGKSLEDTAHTFPEYLERLLVSRGYFYWIQTLCPAHQASAAVKDFRHDMPLLFDDYDDALFHPKAPGGA